MSKCQHLRLGRSMVAIIKNIAKSKPNRIRIKKQRFLGMPSKPASPKKRPRSQILSKKVASKKTRRPLKVP